jgi:hypothetical protein
MRLRILAVLPALVAIALAALNGNGPWPPLPG